MLNAIMLSLVMQTMPAVAIETSDRSSGAPVAALAGDRPKTGSGNPQAEPPKRPKANPGHPPKRPKVPNTNPGPTRPKAGPAQNGKGKNGDPGKGGKKGG